VVSDTRKNVVGIQNDVGDQLNRLLEQAGEESLQPALVLRFRAYLDLLLRWNARVNLTGIRDAEGILSRHFIASIICARALPAGVGSLLDLGSGAGFPGIPIALCRPEISVTLAEAQAKKAAFLQEALRILSLGAIVYGRRAETLGSVFDCVVMRAVDKMEKAVAAGSRLVAPKGWLVLMATGNELPALEAAAGLNFEWVRRVPLPSSEDRIIALGVGTR